MFGFKRKKDITKIMAPVIGKSVMIEKVPDETFAMKLMGEGVAFEFTGSEVCAPVTGKIVLIAESLHAFGICDENGIEILIHIGLETVGLNGNGFTKLKEAGQLVECGEPIIKVDQDFMKANKLNLITMMIITNTNNYQINLKNLNTEVDLNTTMIECTNN